MAEPRDYEVACRIIRDMRLTNHIKTTAIIYTIQTEITHNILASSPTTGRGVLSPPLF